MHKHLTYLLKIVLKPLYGFQGTIIEHLQRHDWYSRGPLSCSRRDKHRRSERRIRQLTLLGRSGFRLTPTLLYVLGDAPLTSISTRQDAGHSVVYGTNPKRNNVLQTAV